MDYPLRIQGVFYYWFSTSTKHKVPWQQIPLPPPFRWEEVVENTGFKRNPEGHCTKWIIGDDMGFEEGNKRLYSGSSDR
jgi:hypothetical protein